MGGNEVELKARSLLRRFGLAGVPWQVLACAGVLLLVLLGVALWRFWPTGTASQDSDFSIETTEEETAEEGGDAQAAVAVDVEGAVKKPGLYVLESGARVGEAIEAAGGLKKTAAKGAVNLAQEVEDGMQVYIPSKAENASGATQGNAEAENSSGSATSEGTGSGAAAGKVNLNTASSEELQTLSGIGEVLAGRIVDYREKNGSFTSTEDLKNVSGIGETRFAALEGLICV